MKKRHGIVAALIRAGGAATIAGAILFAGSPAGAITNCKAKVDKRTGLIKVSGTGADASTLKWGNAPGTEINPFFDPVCVNATTLKATNCTLADPLLLASKSPPPECTLYLNDVNGPCSVWIPGCVPGVRRGRAILGYAWADQPSTPTYTPDINWQYNSTGALNTITRSGVGTYQVTFPGISSTTPGLNHVQVAQYRSFVFAGFTTTCRVQSWDNFSLAPDLLVNVECRDVFEAPVDEYFVVQVTE